MQRRHTTAKQGATATTEAVRNGAKTPENMTVIDILEGKTGRFCARGFIKPNSPKNDLTQLKLCQVDTVSFLATLSRAT